MLSILLRVQWKKQEIFSGKLTLEILSFTDTENLETFLYKGIHVPSDDSTDTVSSDFDWNHYILSQILHGTELRSVILLVMFLNATRRFTAAWESLSQEVV